MPRLPGRREFYEVADVDQSFVVYVSQDGRLACHGLVENMNEHLFVGPSARDVCLRDLRARVAQLLSRPGVELQRTDTHVVLEFPFPDGPWITFECP